MFPYKLLLLVSEVGLYGSFGSNIPVLPLAKSYSNITAGELAQQCNDIKPENRSPPLKNGAATAEIEFAIDHFIAIEDVSETISVTAALYVKWEVATCSSNSTAPHYTGNERERIMVMDPEEEVWHPAISFRNAVDDISMKSEYFSNRMEILFDPNSNRDNRILYFYWKRRGIFRAVCNLDLSTFPFDTQECTFQFYLVEATHLIIFSEVNFTTSLSKHTGAVDGWTFIDGRATVNFVQPDGDDNVSQAIFYVKFKRRPDYFVNNLLAPCIVLAGLELVAFLIPPTESDRVCFSVYLLLAFAVGQSQVLTAIPKTPQFVLLNYFIQLLALVCGLCTIYAIFVFWFVSCAPEKANRKCGRIRLVSVVEIVGFVFFLLLFIAVSLFCISQAGLI